MNSPADQRYPVITIRENIEVIILEHWLLIIDKIQNINKSFNLCFPGNGAKNAYWRFLAS
jgi:hypothetical protein